jgi:hypothetical protein
MRRTLVAFALSLAVAGPGIPHALAQALKAKSARGTVTAMTADSVTVKVVTVDMTFRVDAKTRVQVAGAGTREKAGASGPKLADVISVGQTVSVSYHDMGGKMYAASITVVSSAGDPCKVNPNLPPCGKKNKKK